MRAALFMIISMGGFAMTDAITKHVSESMNVGEVMFLRGVFATVIVSLLAWYHGLLGRIGMVTNRFVMIRVGAEMIAGITFLTALANLPLANVSALLQALPLAVTMGAALFCGESVGWRRWLSIAAGFVGVAIIVRPGFGGFNVYSLMALACVLCCAVRDLTTKSIPVDVPVLIISTATTVAITLFGALLIQPLGGWSHPGGFDLFLLAISAALILVGYQFIVKAVREGEMSFIAPFRYTSLLFSIILGFLIFGDVPDLPMIVGSAIVVMSGLYALYRERVVGRSTAASESVGPAMGPDSI